MAGKGLLIVVASISPEKEEAFNRWYNEEHLPKVLARVPGVLSGRRYKIVTRSDPHGVQRDGEEKYRYMAMYEFESYEALESAYKEEIEQLTNEYDGAFGQGGRYQIRAVEVKSLKVG